MAEIREPLAPRIPRAEAVGMDEIVVRLDRLVAMHEQVVAEIDANQREYLALAEREHMIVSEHERLRLKLSEGERG